MTTILIPVEQKIALIYNSSKGEEKEKINLLINLWLKEISVKSRKKQLFKTIALASKEAQEKGLTPRILQKILNERK